VAAAFYDHLAHTESSGVRLQPLRHCKPNAADYAYLTSMSGCPFIPDNSDYSPYA